MDRAPGNPTESPPSTSIAGTASSAAIDWLSTQFRAPLRRFFEKRKIPRDDIDDLVQDVFLRLSARSGINTLERQEAYLFATAANLLRDRHRYLTSRAALKFEPYDEPAHGGAVDVVTPERDLHAKQAMAQVFEALFELPERTRVIFTLYHLEDIPQQAIARSLSISVRTVEKHMARANAFLVGRMERL